MIKIRLHKEGYPILFGFFFFFLIFIFGTYHFIPFAIVSYIVALIAIVFMALGIYFFRKPVRIYEDANNELAIVAPADGKVVVIEEVDENQHLKQRCLQVSIFMSILSVHANWYPINGTVRSVKHIDGAFYKAFLPKSSHLNEHSEVIIESKSGDKILIKQIAGAVARRVVTYSQQHKEALINDKLGFIKFGSRVDIFIPLGSSINVSVNDKVVGNQTTIGYLPRV